MSARQEPPAEGVAGATAAGSLIMKIADYAPTGDLLAMLPELAGKL